MDAIFIAKRMEAEYQRKDKKLYMCFVDMEKAFVNLAPNWQSSIRA